MKELVAWLVSLPVKIRAKSCKLRVSILEKEVNDVSCATLTGWLVDHKTHWFKIIGELGNR